MDVTGDVETRGLIALEQVTAIAHIAALQGKEAACSRQLTHDFGLALPSGPHLVTQGELSILGVGPGRWLAMKTGAGHEFAARMSQVLDDCAAVNDLNDAYVVWHFHGPSQRDMLARLVAIDVHERAFPVGRTVQTVASHVGVLLWRLEDQLHEAVFALAVARSYSQGFRQALEDAAGVRGMRFEPA